MKLIQLVNHWLDGITMYRVVLYVLVAYTVAALVLSLTPYLYYSAGSILLSLSALSISGIAVHFICKSIWKAPANFESTLITILILFCIFDPVSTLEETLTLVVVSAVAIVSKYIFVWRNLHIFNPVVIAAVAVTAMGLGYAAWWIATPPMFIITLIGGFLITAKIRRWELVAATILSAVLVRIIVLLIQNQTVLWSDLYMFFFVWPIVFFATVMVTEPTSTPAGSRNHIIYGSLVGVISSLPFGIWTIHSSPELALLIGNIIMYPTTLRARLVLKLQSVKKIAARTYEYIFTLPHKISFTAGQYLEWSLPHENHDRRGMRRYFTIASSPTEDHIMVGLKIPEGKTSRFKQELQSMKPGDVIYATSLDGDFVLPEDLSRPLVFIAGGIGVTPFRSMVKYLIDTDTQADITMFNCNSCTEDIAWSDLWQEASESFNMKVVNLLNDTQDCRQGEQGYLTKDVLEKYVSDIHNARYYISGPPGMVDAYKTLLVQSGVKRSRIKTDFFPGLA